MKKFNASVLLDSLFSFIMISILCITLIPLITLTNKTLQDQQNDLELKSVLLSQLIRTDTLPDITHLNYYVITRHNNKICIKKENNKTICYQQKS